MGRPEERTARDAERQWQKALAEHAVTAVRAGLAVSPAEGLRVGPDQGGLCVEVQGPDGEWRRYFVRLTEASPFQPLENFA